MKKKVIAGCAVAFAIGIVAYIAFSCEDTPKHTQFTEREEPKHSAGGGDGSSGHDETEQRRFQSLFMEMEDTGEYQRGPEDPESPGAKSREMFALMSRLAKMEGIPKQLLLPTAASPEEVERHMQILREILQYEALVKEGTATIQQKEKLYTTKKRLFEKKIRQIEAYRHLNTSEQDQKAAEKSLKLLRERISACDEELRRL